MLKRHNPTTVRPVNPPFDTIFAHVVELQSPQKLYYIAGQIGVDPQGQTPAAFDAQCHETMNSVEAILSSFDLSVNNILRVVYYVTDPVHLPALTKMRQDRWGAFEAPAVTTLVVAALARPELLVEIEVTAGC